MTPWILRCSSFPNTLVISWFLLLTLSQMFQKTQLLAVRNGRGFHTLQGLGVRVPGGQGGGPVVSVLFGHDRNLSVKSNDHDRAIDCRWPLKPAWLWLKSIAFSGVINQVQSLTVIPLRFKHPQSMCSIKHKNGWRKSRAAAVPPPPPPANPSPAPNPFDNNSDSSDENFDVPFRSASPS